jgi:hypothetical protein
VSPVLLGPKANAVLEGRRVHKGCRASGDRQANLDHRDPLARKGIPDRQEPAVPMVPMGPMDELGHREALDLPDRQDPRASRQRVGRGRTG